MLTDFGLCPFFPLLVSCLTGDSDGEFTPGIWEEFYGNNS